MSGIGIGSVGSFNRIYDPAKPMNQMASGKKINSAADDAAGFAIAKKLEAQEESSNVAANNARDMRNLLNTADGGMSQISSGLERIRELSVQANNSIYTSGEKSIFQEEIKGILGNINAFAKNTSYNGKTVLDGSFTAQNAVVGANGQSAEINIGSALTDDLGMTGYDVSSGSFDLGSVDKALDALMSQQAQAGAYSNRLEYSERVAETAAINQESARSRIEDTDMAQAAMENNRRKVTEQVGVEMQKMRMQGMGNFLQIMGR